MTFPTPGTPESPVQFKDRYDNFIGGKWIPPVQGRYFENISPVSGHPFCEVARSDADDIDLDPCFPIPWAAKLAHHARHFAGDLDRVHRPEDDQGK